MRSVKTQPKAPASRHDNRAGEPAAATNHNALRSASASMIVHVFVNHVNQVVIHDGFCQGSGGAPGTALKAQDGGQAVSRSDRRLDPIAMLSL